ncbi:MAG TPA: quinone-dependent dihydroorotate dehydrogenase [Myxococcota bacterium]|nr:quinone-dependent dihydroorotate dehydrogenase [Myxococcota bacterium]
MKPLLFALDPERAHGLAISIFKTIGAVPPLAGLVSWMYRAPPRPVNLWGQTFANPVGLAAGWDKDGLALRGLHTLGFGHVELGTVTPRPQPGHDKPRVFRLREDRALINRMGFPSRGAEHLERRLALRRNASLKVGVNLGRNKDTPNERALDDYAELVSRFAGRCDYLVVNVSSPNTAGLRDLQHRDGLSRLLTGLVRHRAGLPDEAARRTPLLVKLSPDLSEGQLEEAVGVALDAGLDGIIATNTTLSREGLSSPLREQAGGASGALLSAKAQAVLERVVAHTDGKLPIIAAGGVMGAEDAKRRLGAGASLVQVYTGLVFAGPGLVRAIVKGLSP